MKITQSKSQISIEFLIIAGILTLILIAMLSFSSIIQKQTTKTETNFGIIKECFKVSRVINSVYVGGDGSKATIKINYIVNVFNDSSLGVEDLKKRTSTLCGFYARTPGDLTAGTYSEFMGDLTIENIDGFVEITNETT